MNFTLHALQATEGDQMKADYMLNCKVMEYYWRLVNRKKYVDWVEKGMADAKRK